MADPTPGDLSARHLAQLQDMLAFSANDSEKPALAWAIAALSALPAAGEPVAWIAADNALQFIDDFMESGAWQPGVRFYTTSQPSAAEELGPHPLNICPKCKDYYMECDCPADAAVGAQGDGVAEHVRRQVGRLAQWLMRMSHNESYFGEPAGLVKSVTEELVHAVDPIYPPIEPEPDPLAGVTIHTATVPLSTAPAAGKGVDDAMVERALEAQAEYWGDEAKHVRCETCKGTGEDRAAGDWCGECGGQGMNFDGDESGAMRAALEAALTRQPVAGDGDADFELWQDGEFVAGTGGPRAEAWREILHYAAQYEQDGAVTIMEVIRRPLAAPAATPTGDGK